ncbi:DUF6252 family protein [Flavobacterium franklandianum]|uniref:Lipoprotein n=1 Tax=Flavobacterium franklandianum TaxID=2594430 RepID=A0A553CMC0_9FLAO|nr:DUF6252 family protein [Flavobacterium franklandianum]TRX21639.1 hypothetical protein FNW17_07090 [Flavobacterium franklandianum]
MKKLLILSLVAFILSSCDKDNDKPKTELEKLPAATQIGANKAGCLVDGMAFLPKGYFPGGSALFFFYQDGRNLTLGISQRDDNKIRSVNIASLNQNLHDNVNVIFPLKSYGSNSKYAEFNINSVARPHPNYYSTTETITGELKITYHNFDKAIMSGTFWFDAVNSEGEIVKVREGRFDVKY